MATPSRGRDVPLDERDAIVDVLYRFAAGQDLRDRSLFESAFSPHATVDFTGPARRLGATIPIIQGRQWIADTIFSAIAHVDTTHSVTNPRVTIYDGQRAALVALVEAQHLPRADHSSHLLLQNIYTVDVWRHDGRWVIEHMRIDDVWTSGDQGREGTC